MGVAIFYSKIICTITVLILASMILIVPAVILSRKNRKKARNVVCGVMGTMVLGAGILIVWIIMKTVRSLMLSAVFRLGDD